MHDLPLGSPSPSFHLRADLAIVRLSGADARSFLHAQLTQSVQDLSPERARPAAYCSAQGRLLANGVLWCSEDNTFWFMVARDVAQGLAQLLRRYVLRASVLIDCIEDLDIFGVTGDHNLPAAVRALPDWSVHHAADGQTWIKAPGTAIPSSAWWRVTPVDPSASALGHVSSDSSAWRSSRLLSGWPLIRAATQGQFLPAALNMDLNGTVHFQKGCYPGQEIIARSHYRGSVKRRLAVGQGLWPATTPAPPDGCDLYAAQGDERPCARLIEACHHDGQLYIAAEVMVAHGPEQMLSAQGPQGLPLTVRLL